MGQREVYNYLMKNPTKWHLTKDMCNDFDCSWQTTNKAIRNLLKHCEVEERVITYKVGKVTKRDRYVRIGVKNEKR